MAHFRKFYTNSSSLSYLFPPRTTITGLIAGILGRVRDSYYEEFSSQYCRIAISIRTPVRKIMQTVNYIRTKSLAEITGSGGHTQIPLEILLPLPPYKEIKYRIYFWHKDSSLMENLEKCLRKGTFVYPPYLGITECIGKISFVDICKGSNLEMQEKKWEKEDTGLITVIPIKQIEKMPPLGTLNGCKLIKEDRMPLEFNSKRLIKRGSEGYLFEKNCKPIKVLVKVPLFHLKYQDKGVYQEEWGTFME